MAYDNAQAAAANNDATKSSSLRRHPKYWLDDGSLVLRTQDDVFKIHRTLLVRHSAILSKLSEDARAVEDADGCPIVHIPDELGVQTADLEALLEHLYHDVPLDTDAPLPRIAAVFRASSKRQLDLPAIHQLARRRLEGMLPSGPHGFVHPTHPDIALTLAVEHDLHSIQKALFYSLATNSELEHDEPGGSVVPESSAVLLSATRPDLSPALASQCKALLNELIAHFTPILFTVATAHHMACTDVFAEAWMPLVIQPALDSNGLCRPLETLETIIELDWRAQGLCEECVKEKAAEWRDEQRIVWEKMDEWLGLPVPTQS